MVENIELQLHTATVDHIPLIWYEPESIVATTDVVIWLTGFSGKMESNAPMLQDLARAGFIAISFDLYQHGARTLGEESHQAMVERVDANRRRYFWPIIAQTAEEFPRVIDWAIAHFQHTNRIFIGGISMGGDIAVTAAGLDHRIEAVFAAIATPDWMRPGSIDPQGEPDTYAQNFYNRLNPLTHLENYSHLPTIYFENAGADRYVPVDGARLFQKQLREGCYINHPERIEIYEHKGIDHSFPDEMAKNALQWFIARI